MVKFSYLNKAEKDLWLPRLFDLLYENMKEIAPAELSYEQEKAQFLANVSPALDKTPRQILLCFADEQLAGYIQYYIREGLLMVEEMQLRSGYQRTTLFLCFCRHFVKTIPGDIQYIEAYADRRNLNSQQLMGKLGMVLVQDAEHIPFVHMRGIAEDVRKRFVRE